MRYCTGCGAQLRDDQQFCTVCGKPVPDAPGQEKAASDPASVNAFERRDVPPAPAPRKKRSKALPIILISVLILALAAAAVWFFLLRDVEDDEDDEDEKTEQTDTDKEAVFADTVSFSHKFEDEKEYAVITGYADEDELWEVETGRYGASQVDRVQEIGVANDQYYYIEDGDVVALSLLDGSELWRNTEFHGALGDFVFDNYGLLYLCGYFGPDIFVLNQDGRTVDSRASLRDGFIWPYDIRFIEEGGLLITYEQAVDGEGTITINPDTLDVLAVTGDGSPQASEEPGLPTDISLSASSTLQEQGYDHSPKCAMDGSSSTAWVEGASGDGTGEWLRLDFGKDCALTGLEIWSGYQKSETLFGKNSRPARIRITFSDGSSQEFDLTDTMSMQTISFGGKRVTSSLTITIVSVYPGTGYSDVCISELRLI